MPSKRRKSDDDNSSKRKTGGGRNLSMKLSFHIPPPVLSMIYGVGSSMIVVVLLSR